MATPVANFASSFAPPPAVHRTRRRRAYSLLEVLITVLIIQIISSMVMVNVGSVQRTERLSRAAEQIEIALRYARILAMSGGQQAGVEFDTSANTFRVYQAVKDPSTGVISYNTVANAMIPGGQYLINLSTSNELTGVKVSGVSISGGTNPYRVSYGSLGGTLNTPTGVETDSERFGSAIAADVTLAYGVQNMTVRVYQVGEAKVK